ncbi:DEAD/DEAH box helicase [Phycobacter azelaicus]|uniref:DEAD/DEAH box helicase n=1 Tax=Phycobacter azelaicus TaxID=2668075 RepID=UPI0018662901|nr:DEAD/DEAH box helicase [Phycobacter azelaicus]
MKDNTTLHHSGYAEALARVNNRAADAVVGKGRVRSNALRKEISQRLHGEPGRPEAFVTDPGLEAARIWERASVCLDDLAGQLLEEDLVAALDREYVNDGRPNSRRWPRRGLDVAPYAHQLRAWETAEAGKSFMVTSGTGSGKTECFMIPLLNDLLRQHRPGQTGVQAIVLYPLNALIDSQKERLGAWMEPLADRLSYALYNRHLPETIPGPKRRGAEIRDRKTLRADPPSLLVTNVTMLEYMLMRAQDRDILKKSQGTLRWIVLDEAHSYVGAQAAEMALLLRRVREAFGVRPQDVRLAATSATIGEGDEARRTLQRFLADLAGLEQSQVEVIEGQERVPNLPPLGPDTALDPDDLPENSRALWASLASHPRLRDIRDRMRGVGIGLRDVAKVLGRDPDTPGETARVLRVMEAAAQAQDPETGIRFAPWRLHAFHRAQSGIWACIDPGCAKRGAALAEDDADWPFGQVYLTERENCDCGASVFELGACDECGTPWLIADVVSEGPHRILRQTQDQERDDEYILDVEPEDGDETPQAGTAVAERVLIGPAGSGAQEFLRLTDACLFERPKEGDRVLPVTLVEEAERGCCERSSHQSVIVRPQRFGAPFLMGNALPILLEASAPNPSDTPVPFNGRRLLSFTDSRQGTARFSAKLQQEAERTLTRAIIYHSVQQRSGDAEKAAKLREEIAGLRQVVASVPSLQSTIEEKQAELKAAEGGLKPVAWSEMVSRLAANEELRNFACPVWRNRPSKGDNTLAEDPTALAELFLYRELFRRPRLQNNAETMGLARLLFPELVEQARLKQPEALLEVGHDDAIWADLLHAAVDIVFRTTLAIALPETPVDVRHWISPRSALSMVVEPGLPPQEVNGVRNPTTFPDALNTRSNLTRLVYRLTGGDCESRIDAERAGAVLTAIWDTLRKSRTIVQAAAGAWRLAMTRASIAPVETSYECPVTRRLLPYAPAGISMNAVGDPETSREIVMPELPVGGPQGISTSERKSIRTWLESDERVAALRIQGHWTGLHDRTAEFTPFLRAQEHSAQIDRSSLQGYEEEFRQGQINVLNCSTTMEMGVDIPDVGLVVNTNVPPSPANYRQRIGRAGRRGEPWAMAFTFCKDLPLDNMIFREPARLLQAQVAAPQVRLDSATLVQRHVNALLLGLFLREGGGINVKKNMASFMGATPDPDAPFMPDSVADDFLLALKGDWGGGEPVTRAIDTLVTGTCLAGHNGLVARTEDSFVRMRDHWRDEYEQLLQAQAAYPETEPAHRLYRLRARRMREEFMMMELARRGFTPSYGFPVDVVTFDHAGRDGAEAGPARQLDIAIREYSPGSEVVINGLVHRSEGVMPTWGNRNDPSAVEDLRTLLSCRTCGHFGLTRQNAMTCPRCAAPVQRQELLRPSGFLGTRKPHSAYEQLAFVAPDLPRVSACAENWISLPDPEIGRHRTAREGHVLLTASGEHGCGYAICITCGRAAAETDEASMVMPGDMRDHFPLQRLRDNPRHDGKCPGNDEAARKIRRRVKLGTEYTTDVFELQLDALANTEEGRAQAAAIASALREALAARLGVDAETMGIAVAPSLRPDEARRSSVFLYDKASGGSGFASEADKDFPGLLKRAMRRLDCPADCDSGCPECVLRRDLQFGGPMDRRGALKLLRDEILPRLDLPEAMRVFGPETRPVMQPLADWLGRQLNSGAIGRLTLFLTDPPSRWDIAEWPGFRVATEAARAGVPVTIAFKKSDIQSLDMSQKLDLVRLAARGDATVHVSETLPKIAGASVLANATLSGSEIAVMIMDPDAAHVDRKWGSVEASPLLFGPYSAATLSPALSLQKVTVFGEGNSAHKDVMTELDGPVSQFGNRFWKIVRNLRPQAFGEGRRIAHVSYNDRYLRGPLTARLLFEAWRTMPLRDDRTKFEIISEATGQDGRPGYLLWHNWDSDAVRREILSAVFPSAEVKLRDKAGCAHARSFRLTFDDGAEIAVFLDQGFGAWRDSSPRPTRFPHDEASSEQARALVELRFNVALQDGGRFASPIWVRW